MTLRFFEGFNYAFLDERAAGYDGGVAESASGGRNSTGALQTTASGDVTFNLDTVVPEGSTIVIGFAMKYTDWATNRDFLHVLSENGIAVFEINSGAGANSLVVEVGSTEYGSAAVSSGSFIYYEVVVYMHDTAGTIEIFEDGVSVYSTSGIDTKGTTGDINSIRFESYNNACEYLVDDVYVLDDVGTGLTSRLGDVHVVTLNPTGNGTYSDGVGSDGNSTDNYLLVDDADPDSVEYVELAVADEDTYTTTNLGAGVAPVAVRVAAYMGQGDGSNTTAEGTLRISATDYDHATPVTVPLSYALRDWYWEENPNTATDWAEDDLDSVEFGVRRDA